MSSAILDAALTGSLVLCASGLAWRAWRWLRADIGPDARGAAPLSRLAAIGRTTAAALLGRRMGSVLGVFTLDALLLRRLFVRERLRAIAHHVMLAGFTWLLLVHALAPVVASRLLPAYQPTENPWFLLRDVFGAMALAGVLFLVLGRRRASATGNRKRSSGELAFVALLVLMLGSGFLLHAQKIASPAAFERMTDVYAAHADRQDRAALRAWWALEFGVPYDRDARLDPASSARARVLHEEACASCHAKPASAFISWSLSQVFAPIARGLDAVDASAWLLHLHALACIAALASLPFTRLFHAVASPFALLLDGVARWGASPERELPAAFLATRRAVALDACVRCAVCDTACSVAPIARWLGNDALLPSRKLEILDGLARRHPVRSFDELGRAERREALRAAEGANLCTDCGRCTRSCPVGLDLADLWRAGRRDFADAGVGRPDQWIHARTAFAWSAALRRQPGDAAASTMQAAARRGSFERCIQCQACTNVCPVVANDNAGYLDLTPQRVMNLLRLGRVDLALGSRMARACAGCYQCQENCPEGIPVTDIMLELRAGAPRLFGAVRVREARS